MFLKWTCANSANIVLFVRYYEVVTLVSIFQVR